MIAFSDAMAQDAGHRRWALALYDSGRYMRLDAAAQRALNVLRQRTDANDSFSVYGLMNRGRTAMSKRLLKVWGGGPAARCRPSFRFNFKPRVQEPLPWKRSARLACLRVVSRYSVHLRLTKWAVASRVCSPPPTCARLTPSKSVTSRWLQGARLMRIGFVRAPGMAEAAAGEPGGYLDAPRHRAVLCGGPHPARAPAQPAPARCVYAHSACLTTLCPRLV